MLYEFVLHNCSVILTLFMYKDNILATPADQHRIRFCTLMFSGEVTLDEAIQVLYRSSRLMRRTVKAFIDSGVTSIIHGNRDWQVSSASGKVATRKLRTRAELGES